MSVQVLILGMVRASCGLASEAYIGGRAGDVLLRTKFIIDVQVKRFGLLEKIWLDEGHRQFIFVQKCIRHPSE